MKYIWPILIAATLLSACSSDDNTTASIIPDDNSSTLRPERITFEGGGELGIFDPSIARDPDTGRLWMSYSAVDSSTFYASDLYWGVSLRLAFSDDSGAIWQDAGVSVSAFTEQVVGPVADSTPPIDADSAGIWQSETSTLVYDPDAPLSERWKLIWFQYLNVNLTPYFFDYSWIALKVAATPLELASATTIKLFGRSDLHPDGEITASPVFSPVAGSPAILLDTDFSLAAPGKDLSDLDNCIFAEPGLHATNDGVYMAIFCADFVSNENSLMYFMCNSPCDMTVAANWTYLGKLLTPADAEAVSGHDHYQAPAIADSNGRTYLLATPVRVKSSTDIYEGCEIFEFSDIGSSDLVRNTSGIPVVADTITGETGTHNGACAAFRGLSGGIILSQFERTNPPDTFRIYKSQISLP